MKKSLSYPIQPPLSETRRQSEYNKKRRRRMIQCDDSRMCSAWIEQEGDGWRKRRRGIRGVRGRPFLDHLSNSHSTATRWRLYLIRRLVGEPAAHLTPFPPPPLPEVRWTRGLIPLLSGAPTWRSTGPIVTIPPPLCYRSIRDPTSRSDYVIRPPIDASLVS